MFELMKACFEIDLHGGHETSIYSWPGRRPQVLLTKRPMDIMVIGPVPKWVSALHVAYMIRDPRDMCVSKNAFTCHIVRIQPHGQFRSLRCQCNKCHHQSAGNEDRMLQHECPPRNVRSNWGGQ